MLREVTSTTSALLACIRYIVYTSILWAQKSEEGVSLSTLVMTMRLAAFERLWADQALSRFASYRRPSFHPSTCPALPDQLSRDHHASRSKVHRSAFAMPTRQAWVYRPSSIKIIGAPSILLRLVRPSYLGCELSLTHPHEHRGHEALSALRRRRRMGGTRPEQRNPLYGSKGPPAHHLHVPPATY
ncbi:hypothetical protein EDB83DRAFT_273277 [Lactarius deliciosus]|nr:hypothetical protein EDB83DRAFT_273277 [Lactarius deliciosus]